MYGYINCSLIFHIQNLDGLHDDFHACTRTSVPALRMVTAAVIRNPDANTAFPTICGNPQVPLSFLAT